jgi:hypothetical protein
VTRIGAVEAGSGVYLDGSVVNAAGFLHFP